MVQYMDIVAKVKKKITDDAWSCNHYFTFLVKILNVQNHDKNNRKINMMAIFSISLDNILVTRLQS